MTNAPAMVNTLTAFPENEVEVLPAYLGTARDQLPSATLAVAVAALNAASTASIQTRYPFHPFQRINQAAFKRHQIRLAVTSILNRLAPTLDALHTVQTNVARNEFGLAAAQLAAVPPVIPGTTLTIADIAEAFDRGGLSFEEISGDPAEPTVERRTLPGYTGPLLDAQELIRLCEIVSGGAERVYQVGLLQAEIACGRRDAQSLVHAFQAYAALLPAARTTPMDLFGVHLDVFEEWFVAPTTPRQRFVAVRYALAVLALADLLFRRQRALGSLERQAVTRVYDAAVRLVQLSGISSDNPRRREVETHARLQTAKLQARLNYLGLWDSFVPVQRYTQLEQDAASQIAAAKASADSFFSFLNMAEAAVEQQMDVQFQQDRETDNLAVLDVRQANATLGIAKINEQIRAIDDHRSLLRQGLDVLAGSSRSIVEAVPTGKKEQSVAPIVVAAALIGIASSIANAVSQDNELKHQRRIAEIEREIAVNEREIAGLERELSEHRIAIYAAKRAFLGNKRLNADFFYSMAELNRTRAERQLEVAMLLAYLFERALAFFLGEPNSRHIQFDYLDRPGRVFDAAAALNEDFQRVLAERDKVNALKFDFFEQPISLRESYPLQFNRFLQTGEMDFVYSLYQLSKLRPATHQVRLREVGVEIQGLIPTTGFSGTLTHRGRFLVRDRQATLIDPSATRLIPTDEQLAQALDEQRQQGLAVAAVGGVLLYDLESDTKELSVNTQFVSPLPPNQDTLNVFEGHGPTGLWHLDIRDHGRLNIADVLLHFAVVSRTSDVDVLAPRVEELIHSYEVELAEGDALDRISAFSLRESFPDAYFALGTGAASFTITQAHFPQGMANLQTKLVLAQAIDADGEAVAGVTLRISRRGGGFSQLRKTLADGFTENLDAPPQILPRDQRFPVPGGWQIRLSNRSQFAKLGDLKLFVMYTFEEL